MGEVTVKEGIDIPRWFRAMVPWFRRGVYFWGAVGLPLLAFLVAFFVTPLGATLEDRFRLAGLALNIAGLAVVAIELARTQGQFAGKDARGILAGAVLAFETVWTWIKQYFLEIPRWRFRDITVTASAAAKATATADATFSYGIDGKKSPEQRLDELEAKQKEDRKSLEELKAKHKATAQAVADLRADVEHKARQAADTLKVFATEGIPAQAMGWVLLLCGTVLDGAARELACLLTR